MSVVEELLTQIAHFDCDPGIYQVRVVAASHRAGYQAIATFRGTRPFLDEIGAHADTPEEALELVYKDLKERWGICPACGEQRHGH